MKRYAFFLLCVFALMASGVFAADTLSLVRVSNISKAQISLLVERGLDIPKIGQNYIEAVLGPKDTAFLKKQGCKLRIIINDLDSYVKGVQKAQNKAEAYYTYGEASAQLKKWAEQYKDICVLCSIGKTFENRDIWALKISDNPEINENEPAALIMGAHHAREWPSFEVPMAAIKQLLEGYGSDDKITELVNNREVWFVPFVNPDGVVYSQEKSKFWRKNRRDNEDGSFGVDINRNYPYKWGNVGASDYTSSDTYHGKKPLSEAESQAIVNLMNREKFQASISFHTYSQLILYPFGYGHNIPNPDEKVFKKMASDMAKFNKYTPQNSAALYPAMGDPDDYSYGELKTLAFTIELCRSFIPPASTIADTNEKNVPAVMYLIEKAGTYALSTPAGRSEIINELSLNGAIAAIKDNVDLFEGETAACVRSEVLKQIEKISLRAAELVCEELKNGSFDGCDRLKAVPQAALALKFVKNRVRFESAYREADYRSDVLNQLK